MFLRISISCYYVYLYHVPHLDLAQRGRLPAFPFIPEGVFSRKKSMKKVPTLAIDDW